VLQTMTSTPGACKQMGSSHRATGFAVVMARPAIELGGLILIGLLILVGLIRLHGSGLGG
jgi:hypothetical protein